MVTGQANATAINGQQAGFAPEKKNDQSVVFVGGLLVVALAVAGFAAMKK